MIIKGNTRYSNNLTGEIFYQYHRDLEKGINSLNNVRKATLQSICQICGDDLYSKYGSIGINLLEMHLGVPIEQYSYPMKPLPSQFVAVCPTCHKLAHSEPLLYGEENLRQRLQKMMKRG